MVPMQTISQALKTLHPSALAAFSFCERSFWINQHYPTFGGVASLPLVFGNTVHEAYRVVSDTFRTHWPTLSIATIPAAIPVDVRAAVDFVEKLSTEQHPEFSLDIRRELPLVEYGLRMWAQQHYDNLVRVYDRTDSLDVAVEAVVPETEVNLVSKKLGLSGRADLLYTTIDKTLQIKDIKTDQRTTTFLKSEGHKLQVLSYGQMGIETRGLNCDSVGLLYSRDMTEVNYPFNKKNKKFLVDSVTRAREIIASVIPPPVLDELEQSAKCPRCYCRQKCMKLAEDMV